MTRVPDLGLEYLSVFGLDPVRFVHLAHDLNCPAIGLNLAGAANALAPGSRVGFRHNAEQRQAIARALHDTGVRLALVEGIAVVPETDVADLADDLDHVAGMGAAAICAVSIDRDRSRTRDQFRRLAEMAAERGLFVTTEIGAGVVRGLGVALETCATVDHPAFGLLVDTMHFFRTGATLADFVAIDPALIRHVQLCDVPMPALIESYREEALYERRAPGDGDLPLAALVRHIPSHATIGLEVPIRSQALAGVADRDRLSLCLQKARQLWAGEAQSV